MKQQLLDDAFEEQTLGERPFPETHSRKRSSQVMSAGMDFDAPMAAPVKSKMVCVATRAISAFEDAQYHRLVYWQF